MPHSLKHLQRKVYKVASSDSLDWKGISAEEMAKRVNKGVGPGSIMLFHNAGEHTPEALPLILDHLKAEGYSLVPISELILPAPYTLDHTGRQFAGKTE